MADDIIATYGKPLSSDELLSTKGGALQLDPGQYADYVASQNGLATQNDLLRAVRAREPEYNPGFNPVPDDGYRDALTPEKQRAAAGTSNVNWQDTAATLEEARQLDEAERATPAYQYEHREVQVPKYITLFGERVPVGSWGHDASELKQSDDGSYESVESPWGQLIADFKTAPLYPFFPWVAASIDMAEGVAKRDPVQAATSVFGLNRAKPLMKFLGPSVGLSLYGSDPAEGANFGSIAKYGSKLMRTVEQMQMGGAQSVEQIARTLRNAGVKQEELDWVLRVNELERGTKMSKDDLLSRIEQNRIQPDEIVRGGDGPRVSDDDLYNEARFLRDQFVEDTIGPHLDNLFDGEWNRVRMPEVAQRPDGTFDVHDYNGELLGNYSTRGRATLARDEADDLERAALDERIRGDESEARGEYERLYSDDDFMEEARERLYDDADGRNGTEFGDYKLDDGENYQELTISLPKSAREATGMEPYRGGHFKDAPDTIAHARTQERRLQDGNSFHVDEVQGDLHQAARSARKEEGARVAKRMQQEYGGMSPVTDERNAYGTKLVPADYGYLTPAKKAAYDEALAAREDARTLAERTASEFYSLRVAREAAIARDLDDTPGARSGEWSALDRENWVKDRMRRDPELADAERRMDDARNAIPPMPDGANIPDAPLKTNWHEMAFRRMLNEASQRGFDNLTWTSGKQQVDRYGDALRDTLDELRWEKTPDGVHLIGNKNDTEVLNTRYGEDKLSDVVGSAMAKRITEDTGQSGVIRGDDITIDDQGMSGFYDGNLRKYVQAIAKKYNSKVTKHIMPDDPNYYAGRSTDPSSNYRFVVRDKKTGEVVSGHEDLDAAHEAAADLGAEYVHRLRMSPELRAALDDESSGLKDFFKDGGRVDFHERVRRFEKGGSVIKRLLSTPKGAAKGSPTRASKLDATIAELEKRGLPMDADRRMARAKEQGYVPDLYHGTASDVSAFDKQLFGSSTKAAGASRAAWLVDDPRTAAGYAEHAAGRPVRELLDKSATYERLAQKSNDPHWWDKQDEAARMAEELDASGGAGQNVMPLMARGNLMAHDFSGAEYTDVAKDIARMIKEAEARGYDGLKLLNLADDVASNGRPATHYAIFDPKNIRSKFAQFDPNNLNSPNLLAGAAGVSGSALAAEPSLDDIRAYLAQQDGGE